MEEVLNMKRVPVQSSNIASVGYDPASSTLEIEFHSGGVYQYSGVSSEVYEGLMNASSKGSYFHHNIKMAGYPFKRMR